MYGDMRKEADETQNELIKTQKELTERVEKSNAEQREQTELTKKIREQMRQQFEEYMRQKDSDMTTRGELHLVRCLHRVVMETAESLDSESKDLATTIAEGVMCQMEERLDLLYLPHSEIIDRFFPDPPSDMEYPEPDTVEGLRRTLLQSDKTLIRRSTKTTPSGNEWRRASE